MKRLLLGAVLALLFAGPALAQVIPAQQQGAAVATGSRPYSGGAEDAPKVNAIVRDPVSLNRLVVNPDGSINARALAVSPYSPVQVAVSCPAVNVQPSISVTPPAGTFVYLMSLEWQYFADSTGGTGSTADTLQLLNMIGTTSAVTIQKGVFAGTASTTSTAFNMVWGYPGIHSYQPGTLVKIQATQPGLHTSDCLVATYYLGP